MKRILLVIFSCISATIIAQNTGYNANDTLYLNLDSAINIALRDNPTIQIAGKNIELQKEANSASWEQMFSLSATGQYSRSIKKQVIFLPEGSPMGGGAMEIGSSNSFNLGLSASLALVSPALWNNIKMTKTDITLAMESARASKINMVNEVKKAYYGAMLAEYSYKVLQQSAEVAQKNYDNVKVMFEQGMVAEYDLIRADVSVRNIKPNLVRMKTSTELSKLMIKVLLALPEDMNIKITASLDDFEKDATSEQVVSLFDLSDNTDLIQMQLNIDKMHQQLDLVNSARIPTLAAFGNLSTQSQSNDFKFADYKWASPTSIGLQLSVPLWDIYATSRKTKQVRLGINQLEMQKQYLQQNVSVQARNSINSMLEAKEQVESNKEGVAQAEKGLQISQTRYSIGAGTILELNDSEVALTQAKLNYSQSIYNYLIAKSELEKVLGKNQD